MTQVNGKENEEKYDLFICHASEDKDTLVRELALGLRNAGVKIWYDEFSLHIGDSLRRSIDKGLSNSTFGIVVLSKSFFKKDWPQRELDGLAAKEVNGKKVILPVWYEVTRDEVLSYSPTLADKVAAKMVDGLAKVLSDILAAIRIPDFANELQGNPRSVSIDPPSKRTVSGLTSKVLQYMVSEANRQSHSMPEADEVMKALNIGAIDYKSTIDELVQLNLVYGYPDANHASGYARAKLLPHAFVQLLGQVIPDIDIVDELKRVLDGFNKEGQYTSSSSVTENAGVPLPRLRVIVDFLRAENLIDVTEGYAGDDKPDFLFGKLLPLGVRVLSGHDPIPVIYRYIEPHNAAEDNSRAIGQMLMPELLVTEEELRIIDDIYADFREKGRWKSANAIQIQFTSARVESLERRSDVSLIAKYTDYGMNVYKLTWQGFFASNAAKGDAQILSDYLEFVKRRFRRQPDLEFVLLDEVIKALRLDKAGEERLFQNLVLTNLWAGPGWPTDKLNPPNDVVQLVECNTVLDYLKRHFNLASNT